MLAACALCQQAGRPGPTTLPDGDRRWVASACTEGEHSTLKTASPWTPTQHSPTVCNRVRRMLLLTREASGMSLRTLRPVAAAVAVAVSVSAPVAAALFWRVHSEGMAGAPGGHNCLHRRGPPCAGLLPRARD